MAIGDNYITRDQVKGWMTIQGTEYDTLIDDVVASISREIEDICHRQFNQETAATARVYDPVDARMVVVDDFYTTTGLIVETDDDGDGVFETTWDATDYELRPLNGVANGRTGYPYWQICVRQGSSKRFHQMRSANVRVTASWGWSAVPSAVFQAAKLVAADTFQMKDSRLGIAGSDQFGTVVRVRENVVAKNKLKPYIRRSVICA